MRRLAPLTAFVALALVAAGCDAPQESATNPAPPPTAANSPAEPSAAPEDPVSSPESAGDPKPAKVEESKFVKLDGGLKYAILKEGSGPGAGHQEVVVHYTGWLEDGTVFDSSVKRNEPFPVVLGHGQVIPGWEKGLLGIKAGEKRQLVIPSDLAYGDEGMPPTIPPKATLTFEVEALSLGEAHSH